MSEKPPRLPPPGFPGLDDPQEEEVTVTEGYELFPDEPAGRNNLRRENLTATEAEVVRHRTKTDEQNEERLGRVRAYNTDEGRVELRIDGEDSRFTLFSCNICKALLLRTGTEDHGRWHERLRRGQVA